MAYDPSRYRFVNFLGGRILQAREINTLQDIAAGVDPTSHLPTVLDLEAVYVEGAVFNIQAVITPGTKTVTLTKIDNAKPMRVFVRGRWESLKVAEAPAVTLTGGQSQLFLNWSLVKKTSADDTSLVDATTLEATAEMGELVLEVSATDTSGVALDTNTQFEKNTSPIVLFAFTPSGNTLIPVAKDNVEAQALASDETAGLVKTTTGNPLVVSTDDSRMTNGRVPTDGSVIDAKVRTPLQDGTAVNADGTPRYDLTKDDGGINSSKIVHQAGTQRVSDALENLKTGLAAVDAELNAHEGAALGAGTTHPFPTAAQVGAAPASHVSDGPEAAHGLTAARSTGGYAVSRNKTDQDAGHLASAAFGISDVDGILAALRHDGDVFSKKANAEVAAAAGSQPGGALGLLSTVAHILAAHVGQRGNNPTVSNANPHGQTIYDLGFDDPECPPWPDPPAPPDWMTEITAAKNWAKDQAIAAARAYTDSKIPTFSVRGESTNILWGIISIHNADHTVELAVGAGMIGHGDSIQWPRGFSQGASMAAMGDTGSYMDGKSTPEHFEFHTEGSRVLANCWDRGGHFYGNGSVVAITWREFA